MQMAQAEFSLPENVKHEQAIQVRYKNWQGETAIRNIIPTGKLRWGSTEWHPKEQWLLEVWDIDRKAYREYALCDIVEFL